GQLAVAGTGSHPVPLAGAALRPAPAAAAAALRDADDPPGESVLYPAVLLHHHQLEYRPGRVYRCAGPGRAGLDRRPDLLPGPGDAPLAVPGVPQPDAVRRAAHRAADHPAIGHRAELPLGAGHRPAAGPAQP